MNEYRFVRSCCLPSGSDRGLHSSCGSKVGYKYIELLDEKGMPYLKEKEPVDLVALHNADLASCDIKAIVSRFQKGDLTALMQGAQPFFDDIRSMPQDAMQMYNALAFARQTFDRLPTDIKEQYGNNYHLWLNKCMSGDEKTVDTLRSLGVDIPVPSAPESKNESEVNTNESEQ